MARVTVTALSANWRVTAGFVTWNPASGSRISLGTSLSERGATELIFSQLTLYRAQSAATRPGTIWIRLGRNQSDTPSVAGPEFSTQMETSGTITLTASNGSSVTISGIGDSTEPYQWLPSNAIAVRDFANTLAGLANKDVTVTFDDGVVVFPTMKHNGKAATAAKYNGQAISAAKYNGTSLFG